MITMDGTLLGAMCGSSTHKAKPCTKEEIGITFRQTRQGVKGEAVNG
jgi:hypothetical protein